MAKDERTDLMPHEHANRTQGVLEIKFPEQKELEEIFSEWHMYFPLQRITVRGSCSQ